MFLIYAARREPCSPRVFCAIIDEVSVGGMYRIAGETCVILAAVEGLYTHNWNHLSIVELNQFHFFVEIDFIHISMCEIIEIV